MNNYGLSHGDKSVTNCSGSDTPGDHVKFYAHTADGENGEALPESTGKWQPLTTHLRNVAKLAKQFASPLGLPAEAELAGQLHDLGKYRDEFQAYLRGERGSSVETQHAIFGAAWARERNLASTLPVAGHHAGLHDCGDLPGMLAKPALRITQTLPELIVRLETELGPLPPPPPLPSWVKDDLSAEFYTRLLFSCLVDADRLDTACQPETPPPDRVLQTGQLLEQVHAERRSKAKANPGSPLAVLRNRIFDTAIERAALPPGFFSLTVPTGGGKTLASMAFALAHAKAHGLRRVIVVIPYLSIIE